MKRLFCGVLPALFSLLVVVAHLGVKPMCAGSWHQPEVPEALRR